MVNIYHNILKQFLVAQLETLEQYFFQDLWNSFASNDLVHAGENLYRTSMTNSLKKDQHLPYGQVSPLSLTWSSLAPEKSRSYHMSSF